ncbi:MAG: hypothetical protein JW801_14910 [Bacteroidales bacterium]|nr:hypothetical protein [Bacteroidales bacterium]
MKKFLPLALALILVGLLLILTKPSEKNFDAYIKARAETKIHATDTIFQHYDNYILTSVLKTRKYNNKFFFSTVTLYPEHLYNPKTNEPLNPEYEYIGIFGTWFGKTDIFDFQKK